jgi:hypothetical protein
VSRGARTSRYGLPSWGSSLGALAAYIPIARARWRKGPGGFGSCRNHPIVYGRAEGELEASLADVNRILRERGEPETPLNIEGGRDYEAIARPCQTSH